MELLIVLLLICIIFLLVGQNDKGRAGCHVNPKPITPRPKLPKQNISDKPTAPDIKIIRNEHKEIKK